MGPQDIRAERARRDWTQAQLAEQAGVSVDTIQRAEAGKTVLPAMQAAIVRALTVPFVAPESTR